MSDAAVKMQQLMSSAMGADPVARQQAQAGLEQWEATAFPEYMMAITTLLSSDGVEPTLRQLAGLMIKNSVAGRSKRNQLRLAERWQTLDEGTRNQVKHAVLNALNSGTVHLGTVAANALSKIARIELPLGWWPDLIKSLSGAATAANGTPVLQQSSLDAIGFICIEGAEGMEDPTVLQQSASDILNAVTTCLSDAYPEPVRSSAAKALTASLLFVEQFMQLEEARNEIMTKVYLAAGSSDTGTRSAAMECLVNMAHHYYDYLEKYMQHLFELTMRAMEDEERVAIQAVEFWSTLCDEETELNRDAAERAEQGIPQDPSQHRQSHGYILAAKDSLVPVLLKKLTEQDEYQDPANWNLSMASGACLTLVAQTIGDPIVDATMQFMQGNFQSQDWHFREAAMLCFGSILEGPSPDRLMPMINAALPLLLERLKDEIELVRDTAAWCIGRICELHPAAVVPEQDPTKLQTVMTELYKVMTQDQAPRVVCKACWAINNFAENLECEDDATSPMSTMFIDLANALLAVTQRPDSGEANLRVVAYETLNTLIMHGAQDVLPAVLQLVPQVMERLHATLTVNLSSEADMQAISDAQSSLCGLLHVATQRVESSIRPHAQKLMQLYMLIFNQNNQANAANVHQEALMAVGALCTAVGADFAVFMNDFIPVLYLALSNIDQHEVCISAVGVVGDCCRALETNFQPYAPRVIELLVADLRNNEADAETRPPCLAAFGDIAMAINGQILQYLPVIVPLLVEAGSASFPKQEELDEDDAMLDHVLSMRESILDAYTGIIQGLGSENMGHEFQPYALQLLQFVNMVALNVRTPSLTKVAMGVLGDLANTLGPRLQGQLNQDWVRGFITECLHTQDPSLVEVAQWAQSVIGA